MGVRKYVRNTGWGSIQFRQINSSNFYSSSWYKGIGGPFSEDRLLNASKYGDFDVWIRSCALEVILITGSLPDDQTS